jgi:hypothetical protein
MWPPGVGCEDLITPEPELGKDGRDHGWDGRGSHMRPPPTRSQLKLDFEYDDRAERLALEFGIMLVPLLDPGTSRERIKGLAGRMAMLAARRLAKFEESRDPIPCHMCDHPTKHDERARIVICTRCAMEGNTPGSDG